MTIGTTASNDIRIARKLAQRGLPGSFVYAALVTMVALLTSTARHAPLEVGILVSVLLMAGVFRKRLSKRVEIEYPQSPKRWAISFLAATLVFGAAWVAFVYLVISHFGLGWEFTLTAIVTTGLASGAISALCADSRTVIAFTFVM